MLKSFSDLNPYAKRNGRFYIFFNERKHKNLMSAIMECDMENFGKPLYAQAPELEQEHKRLEKEIALEEKVYPVLTVSKIKFFLNNLKNGNINDMKYCKTLISVFVKAVYLYDDKITIIFNSDDKPVTLNDLLMSETEKEHKQNEFCLCSGVVEASSRWSNLLDSHRLSSLRTSREGSHSPQPSVPHTDGSAIAALNCSTICCSISSIFDIDACYALVFILKLQKIP